MMTEERKKRTFGSSERFNIAGRPKCAGHVSKRYITLLKVHSLSVLQHEPDVSKSVNSGERFGTQMVQMQGRVIKFIWIRVDVGGENERRRRL